MPPVTPRNDTEALLHERFQALFADLDTAGDNAQYGHVLDTVFDSWRRLSLHRDSATRRCNSCRKYSFPVERLLGLDNNYTRGARRLIAFASAKSCITSSNCVIKLE
jgi:hypothetical protein